MRSPSLADGGGQNPWSYPETGVQVMATVIDGFVSGSGSFPHHAVCVMNAHLKMLTARAITSPRMEREAMDWMPMASLAQDAIGMTSVGLNARPLVIPR